MCFLELRREESNMTPGYAIKIAEHVMLPYYCLLSPSLQQYIDLRQANSLSLGSLYYEEVDCFDCLQQQPQIG